MRITGTGGTLRVGYQHAAILGQWTIHASGYQPQIEYGLEAIILERDPFWFQQPAHAVSLRMGRRQWIWRDVTISGDTTITGTLNGAPFIT